MSLNSLSTRKGYIYIIIAFAMAKPERTYNSDEDAWHPAQCVVVFEQPFQPHPMEQGFTTFDRLTDARWNCQSSVSHPLLWGIDPDSYIVCIAISLETFTRRACFVETTTEEWMAVCERSIVDSDGRRRYSAPQDIWRNITGSSERATYIYKIDIYCKIGTRQAFER